MNNRLIAIALLIDNDTKVVDVGCDHGYLSKYLIENNITKTIIASDKNELPLLNAKKNIKDIHGIILRLSDGLDEISKEEIETIVISGLGSNTILEILSKDVEKTKKASVVITQSNNNQYIIRKYLTSIGYIINSEKIIKDNNIIYTIIKFTKGIKKYSYLDLYFGPKLLAKKEPLFKEYYADKLVRLEKIPKGKNEKIDKEIEIIKNIL